MTRLLFALMFLSFGCVDTDVRPGSLDGTIEYYRGEPTFTSKVRAVQSQWNQCLGDDALEVSTSQTSIRTVCVMCPEIMAENYTTACWDALVDACENIEMDCYVFCDWQGCPDEEEHSGEPLS